METNAPRLLIKSRPVASGAVVKVNTFALNGGLELKLNPLFSGGPAAGMGLAGATQWHIAELQNQPVDLSVSQTWELCHHLTSQGMGLAGGPVQSVELAEPDLVQKWSFEAPQDTVGKAFAAQTSTAANSCTAPAGPKGAPYTSPTPFHWRWHQSSAFTGLDSARINNGLDSTDVAGERVTIAHLDTGYRDGHALLPRNLDTVRQHNFVDAATPNSAVDLGVSGGLNNPGHGTGTIGLLAGPAFDGSAFPDDGGDVGFVGAAPFAKVIPVRVANSVVEFANSAIALGLITPSITRWMCCR